MKTKLITGPATQILETSDVKTFLRVSGSDEDALILAFIKTATKAIENYTGRALITQTWEQYHDTLPYNDRWVTFQVGPVQSITSFKYKLGSSLLTFDSSLYDLDEAGTFNRLFLKEDYAWPELDIEANAVTIRFVAGYGDAATDVPDDIIQAARLMVGFLYENRDDRITRSPFRSAAMPTAISYLLNPYRLWEF